MNGCLVIGGKAHPLHFTVNHLCIMEEAMGQPLSSLMNGGITGLRAFLWCGLMGEGISREDAGEMIQAYCAEGGSLKELSALLAEALQDAGFFHLPAQEKKENLTV